MYHNVIIELMYTYVYIYIYIFFSVSVPGAGGPAGTRRGPRPWGPIISCYYITSYHIML